MAEFTPITTQEALDEIIGKRIAREREKFADYEQLKAKAAEYDAVSGKSAGLEASLAEANRKLEEALGASRQHETTIAEQAAKLRRYETDSVKTRIAHEMGLPFEIAGRLSGEDEKSIRADAESLRRVIGKNNTAPLASTESTGTTGVSAGYQSLLAQMRGE